MEVKTPRVNLASQPYASKSIDQWSNGLKYSSVDRDFSNPYLSHSIIMRWAKQPMRVLDIGCANGQISSQLRKRGCHVVGVEIDKNLAKLARSHCDEVILGDIQRD